MKTAPVAPARGLAADSTVGTGLRRGTADFAETARRAATGLAAVRPDLTGALDTPSRVLLEQLDAERDRPATLVHGDFHAKNLIHGPGGAVVPVDWPGAYAHSHLGDLYCLLRDARKQGLADAVAVGTLPGVFARESGTDLGTVRRQMATGGLCWTLPALRWVVEEGLRVVPESAEWIDELVGGARAATI